MKKDWSDQSSGRLRMMNNIIFKPFICCRLNKTTERLQVNFYFIFILFNDKFLVSTEVMVK